RDQEVEGKEKGDSDSGSEEKGTQEKSQDKNIEDESHQQEFVSLGGGMCAVLGRSKGKTALVFLLGILMGLAKPLLTARHFFIFGALEKEDYDTTLFWLIAFTAIAG
ncbi:hypothetical protein PENTCL1PPCAC_3990, partial [Pristionchus entomophagus]